MCPVHEAAWWAGHWAALKREAEAQGYPYRPKKSDPPEPVVDNSDLV